MYWNKHKRSVSCREYGATGEQKWHKDERFPTIFSSILHPVRIEAFLGTPQWTDANIELLSDATFEHYLQFTTHLKYRFTSVPSCKEYFFTHSFCAVKRLNNIAETLIVMLLCLQQSTNLHLIFLSIQKINSSVGFDVTNPIHILVLKLLIINLRLLSFRQKVLFYCDDKINRTIPSKGKKYLTNNGKMSVIKVLHLRAINILDRT